jgi:hypothetical protein
MDTSSSIEGLSRPQHSTALDVHEIPCKTWNDFRNKVNRLILREGMPLENKEWVFRGVLNRHPLETTLERACKSWSIPLEELPRIEVEMIREIKRKAFGLGIPLPNRDDCIWWVSLMQHYGSPTRLLDFTYSPYVAAHFAFEQLLHDFSAQEAAVWAVQYKFTQAGGEQAVGRDDLQKIRRAELGCLNSLFDLTEKKVPSVLQVTAYYLHDRITAQQGVFLCPTDVSLSFISNFKSVPGHNKQNLVRKFVLPRNILKTAVAELQKMNITRHSLFPGIGGLAQSLTLRLPYFADLAKHRKRQTDETGGLDADGQKKQEC